MFSTKSNNLGNSIAFIGALLLAVSIFFGFKDGFHLFEKSYLIAMGIGLGLLIIGLYLRVVGKILAYLGWGMILLSILYLVLAIGFDFKFAAFGFENLDKVAEPTLLYILIGICLIAVGSFFTRTREEEAQDRIIAEEQRMISNQRVKEEGARRSASVPHCLNCGVEAGGGILAGNRIIRCLTCGGSFCGKCAKGVIGKACPHCGESSQKNIKFV